MMIEIKELIAWADAERKKANESADVVNARGGFGFGYEAEAAAFFRLIQKLTLLLNTENENGGKNEASNGGKPM